MSTQRPAGERPTTPHEVALLRLVAQRLAGPAPGSPAHSVAWLGAAQGQDLPGALTSVALRTSGRNRSAVVAALDAGRVVRSWPMRGTLHLVPAVDLRWMLDLAAPRVIAQSARRRAQLGLDDAALSAARDLAGSALAGGRRLGRAEIMALWDDAGLAPAGGRGYHLLFHLALHGVLCFGPLSTGRTRGAEQDLVLLEEWVPAPRRLERDEALGEWALRFFRSHGPATAKDFTRWTGLPAADVRTAVAVARPHLASLVVDGVEHLLDPGTPEALDAHRGQARGVMLLPGFDEIILGYADRSATLSREHEPLVVPGGNGVFAPTIVVDGRVVGTWRMVGRGAARRFEPSLFAPVPTRVERAIQAAHAALPGDGPVGTAP